MGMHDIRPVSKQKNKLDIWKYPHNFIHTVHVNWRLVSPSLKFSADPFPMVPIQHVDEAGQASL
jgi:hypothetical protein